jgi:hypothetical protein
MSRFQLCNVTGKEMLGRGRKGRKAAQQHLKGYAWRMGCRKVYWCIFCEEYHTSSAKRGRWQTV